jgi:hypothetical protein
MWQECSLQRCATTCASEPEAAWAVVKVPVDGNSSADELTRRAPRFWSRARGLAAQKPTHTPHPQSYPSEAPRKPSEAILVTLLCELRPRK